MEPSTTTGRKGSLANPEVREDVPGHVIPIIRREFDDFDNEAEKYLGGGTPENEFIGFRLKQGVYGQRQPDVQMIRVKLPWGGVSPEQMDAFASAIEQFVPLKKGHMTTRQNIQVHHVPLRDAASYIRELAESGLSSREGCGNSVRNVAADRPPPALHHLAFVARERARVKGLEMRVGGGTSIMPRVAPTLNEFVTADDGAYLMWAEAVLRIFDRQDWLRVNRARARIKVLVDKVGIDEVRRMVDEELEGDWVAERDFSIEGRVFLYDEEADAPGVPHTYGSPNGDGAAFERFREANVLAQRQEGFSTVQVKVTRGDLTPEQFRGLAQIMREYCGGHARTTVHQNFVLRWVRDEAVYDVWQRLNELALGEAGSDQVNDVVSCPGTDSCKLGITSSMGLNRAVQERIESMNITDPLTRGIHIKMSGCPNGCSQHHIGNIGFYGASIKVGEHTIPAYVAHIGGNYEGGEIVYGA